MKKIVDLSKWNVIKSYAELKNAGVDGAIVKAINSSNGIDGRFAEHCSGLRKANIPIIGAYNYLYANTIGKATAVAPIFMKLCKDQGIKTAWLDIEDACMKNLGSRIADIINIYVRYAKMNDMYVGIYSGSSFYNSYIRPYEYKFEAKLPVWIARYPSSDKEYKPTDTIPSTTWLPTGIDVDGWQYTSKCKIPKACNGYLDLSVWWEDTPFVNLTPSDIIQKNPFTEPTRNVTVGCMGNDANWVLWYLWKFGKLCDSYGNADSTRINGMIGDENYNSIKEVQTILGLEADGIVGKITRSTWKKMC